ncbi:MAG TPA: MlaD family protein, partial [Patescibacteria group bacterium]|nr:MlaD family protein [Patescibacteria group bacterium]
TRDLAVGIVVLLALLILTVGIFSIGSQQRMWVKKTGYHLRVKDANGLQNGSPVRLAGVQVGAISDVSIPVDPNQSGIEVALAIDQAYQDRVRQDSVANVRILTLLGGEKYIELTPGSPAVPALPPGSYITVPESFGMEQLGELSAGLADDIQSISNNVRIILETVQKQEGVVGRMLLDPNFGQETFNDLSESARLMKESMKKVNSNDGLVGRVLNDREFAQQTTESIKLSLSRLEILMQKLTADDGVASRALDPNGKVAASLDNIHQATADLRDFTAGLKEGRGTVGRLVGDEKYGDEVLENIRKISSDLAAITNKLNKGDGSAGALINDPQVYEDLKSVLRGVQQSKMMGGLIRHYRKKGENRQQKDGTQQPDKGAADPNVPDGGH